MYITNEHILIRLRLKTRLGQAPEEDEEEAKKKKKAKPKRTKTELDATEQTRINNLINDFIQLVPDADKVLGTYKNAMTELEHEVYDLSMGLGKVIGIEEAHNKYIESLTKNLTYLEERNKSLNKSYNISSGRAQEFAETLRDLGIVVGVGDGKMMQYAADLKELTGGMLISSKITGTTARDNMLQFQAMAQEYIGLSAEQATGFESYARNIGTSGAQATLKLEKFTDVLADGLGIDRTQALHDTMAGIGELSADARLTMGKIPGELEKSILKAKILGFTMEDLSSAGKHLMDIESSVGEEMEYQLLTGHRLTTEGNKSLTNEYRMAFLKGETGKQQELMAEFVEKEGDTLRTNYMAREKAANLLGMTSEQLAKILEQEKIAKSLGVKELMKLTGPDLEKKVAQLKKDYAADKEGGEAKIAELEKFMKAKDTRTTHEAVVEDNLVQIAQSIVKIGGKGEKGKGGYSNPKINIGGMREKLRGHMTGSFKEQKQIYSDETGAKILGALTKASEVADVVNKPYTEIAGGLNSFGKYVAKLGEVAGDFTAFNIKSGTDSAVKDGNDTIISPDGGSSIRVDDNDIVAAFRPNDKIHETLNSVRSKQMNQAAMASSETLGKFEKTMDAKRIELIERSNNQLIKNSVNTAKYTSTVNNANANTLTANKSTDSRRHTNTINTNIDSTIQKLEQVLQNTTQTINNITIDASKIANDYITKNKVIPTDKSTPDASIAGLVNAIDQILKTTNNNSSSTIEANSMNAFASIVAREIKSAVESAKLVAKVETSLFSGTKLNGPRSIT